MSRNPLCTLVRLKSEIRLKSLGCSKLTSLNIIIYKSCIRSQPAQSISGHGKFNRSRKEETRGLVATSTWKRGLGHACKFMSQGEMYCSPWITPLSNVATAPRAIPSSRMRLVLHPNLFLDDLGQNWIAQTFEIMIWTASKKLESGSRQPRT